jgi:CRP-like cAMP-binding protein
MALPQSIHPHFLKMLSGKVGLGQEEIQGFLAYWDTKVLKKKAYLLNPGDISRETGYVNRGCFRRYVVSESGKESILNFATEDWWVGDLESFFLEKPTRYHVQALEDSEVLTLSRQNYLRVIEIFPKYKSFHEEKIQRTLFVTLDRATAAKVESPEEKYLKLAKEQPDLFQRIPLHYIATYLGIEPESLSRLRKRLTKKP